MKRFSHILMAAGGLAVPAAAVAQYCDDAAGYLASFLVDEERVTVIADDQLSVVREGESIAVANGMPICPGDEVTVEAGATAILRLGELGMNASELTLIGQSVIEVDNPKSVWARVGRLFAMLRGTFDVRLSDGSTLAARGTQFSVNVADEATLVQLEGEVEFRASPDGAPGRRLVGPLQQLDVDLGGSDEAAVAALKPDVCAEVTATNSRIVAAAQPLLPVENQVQTTNATERADMFVAAREQFLCLNDRSAVARLGRVYADWAKWDALRGLEPRIPDMLPRREQAMHANSIADGYRRTGDPEVAIEWYQQALEIDAGLAVAYSGMGDAHRDAGVAAFDPEKTGTVKDAAAAFDLAEQAYRQAVQAMRSGAGDPAGLASVMVNLGNLALLRAGLDPDAANEQLASAREWFEGALRFSGGDAPFAEIGLARIDFLRAVLIPDVRIKGDLSFGKLLAVQLIASKGVELQRRPHLEAARDRLRRLIKRYPGFSAAALELGEVYRELGERDEAENGFRDAIRFDPANVLAFSRLADTLVGRRNKEERRLYESAYRATVPRRYDAILRHRSEIKSAATLDEVVYDIKALTPSPTILTFEQQDSAGRPLTFTNNGSQVATVEEPRIQGSNAFRVTRDDCAGKTLEPEDRCTLRVAFVADNGTHTGRLVLSTDTGPDSEVTLQGSIPKAPVVQ